MTHSHVTSYTENHRKLLVEQWIASYHNRVYSYFIPHCVTWKCDQPPFNIQSQQVGGWEGRGSRVRGEDSFFQNILSNSNPPPPPLYNLASSSVFWACLLPSQLDFLYRRLYELYHLSFNLNCIFTTHNSYFCLHSAWVNLKYCQLHAKNHNHLNFQTPLSVNKASPNKENTYLKRIRFKSDRG